MSRIEDLQKEKQEQLKLLQEATEAANALLAKKESARKPLKEEGDIIPTEIPEEPALATSEAVGPEPVIAETIAEEVQATPEKTKKKRKPKVSKGTLEKKREKRERKNKTAVEQTRRNILSNINGNTAELEISTSLDQPLDIETLNNIAKKKLNGVVLEQYEQDFYEKNSKIIDSIVKEKKNKRDINNALNLNIVGGLGDGTLEQKDGPLKQKVDYNDFSQENVDSILEKLKNGEKLSAEEEALRRTFPLIFSNTDTPYEIPNTESKTEAKKSWFGGVKNWWNKLKTKTGDWFNNAFSSTPEEKAEFQKRMRETLAITDLATEYGYEKSNMKQNIPENQSVKESKKEIETRLQKEFIENIQKEIDAKMLGEWVGVSAEERAQKARSFYITEKEIFEKEKIERAGIFTKNLHKFENWWKNLENKSSGKYWKAAISSTMVGASVIGGGLLMGNLEKNVANIGWRLGMRVGLSTAITSALASNRMRNIISKFKPEDQKYFKQTKHIMTAGGIAATYLMGGWVVAAIAAGGYGLRRIVNAYIDKEKRELIEEKMKAEELLKSEDFVKGLYDRNKMIEKIKVFDEIYSKIKYDEKFLSRYATAMNYTVSTGAGLATLLALTPEIAKAQSDYHQDKNQEIKTDVVEKAPPQHQEQIKSDAPTVKTPAQTMQNTPPETTVAETKITEQNPEQTPPTEKPIEPNPTPETKTDNIVKDEVAKIDEKGFIEVKAGDGGITQGIKRLVDEGKAPKWLVEELGKNPTAKDYANFAEKYGMYHAKDFEDSIRVSVGDSFGFDEKGSFIWKHNGENFTVVKVDEHGHAEEGDWMDKMQDEKFIHTASNDPTIGEWKGGAAESVKKYYEENGGGPSIIDASDVAPEKVTDAPSEGEAGPTIANDDEKIDPNKMVPPEKVTDAPAEKPADVGDMKPEAKDAKVVTVEKLVIDPNPYKLGPAQLEYINSVYENGFLDHVFKNEESLKWWNEISNTKTATDFLNLDPKTITDGAQEKLMRVMQSIYKTTGLEPYHSTVLNPEIPNETIKQYIMRGLQHAYIKGNNLNDINIEGRPITI